MNPYRFSFLVLAAIMLFACDVSTSTTTVTQNIPVVPTGTPISALPTESPTLTASISPSLTATLTRAYTRTPKPPTLTPVPSVTLTPLPTIPTEQVEDIVRSMLLEPQAPCFWGICPGVTTLGEVENIFSRIGFNIVHTNTRDGQELYQIPIELSSGLGISPLLAVRDGIVKSVQIYIDPEVEQSNVEREWLAFSPETLINQYGPPSKVEYFIDVGPGNQYSIVLKFNTVDMILEYWSDTQFYDKVNETFILCPLTDQYSSVRIWLGKEPENTPLPGLSIEDTLPMTLEQFGELMTANPDDACLLIDRKIVIP